MIPTNELATDAGSLYNTLVEPGPKTTEFWGTVATTAVSMIALVWALINHNMLTSTQQALIFGVLSSVLPVVWAVYGKLRGDVKKSAQEQVARVLVQRIRLDRD